MVESISPVRRKRALSLETPQSAEPPAATPPPAAQRSRGADSTGLAPLRKNLPPANMPPLIGPLAMDGAVAQRENLLQTIPHPIRRSQSPDFGMVTEACIVHAPWTEGVPVATGPSAKRPSSPPGMERIALAKSASALQDFPCRVFDEVLLSKQMLPLSSLRTPEFSVGLALEWMMSSVVTSVAKDRLLQLEESEQILRARRAQHELIDALRTLADDPSPVGRLLQAAELNLMVRQQVRLGEKVAVLEAAGRELARSLRSSAHTLHLVVLSGGPLPRPVACLREQDDRFSVFDPACGVFTAVAEELQQVITGIAAAYEQDLARDRAEGEMLQALSVLRNAQLIEVAMNGVDIDHDGIRDGGLV